VGVTLLSALSIDADKDWNAKEIQNLESINVGTPVLWGDMFWMSQNEIFPFRTNLSDLFLQTQGPSRPPRWGIH